MGCYTVPAVSAIMHFIARKKNPELGKDERHKTLNLMFLGGAIFGVVDHAWNRELLSFSFQDVMLGFVITLSIIATWGLMVTYEKLSAKAKAKAGI